MVCIVHSYEIAIWNKYPQRMIRGKKILEIPDILETLKEKLTNEEFLTFQQQLFEEL